ncbi:MAG: glycoside hydrolase family 32 protein [Lachnospiraceae bacterium]|nr:glycoside hydrolase family 32 protein [Candidatus Equihabitans merdae]
MKKQYLIDAKYLSIPVAVDKECALVEFFLIKEGQEPEKVMEFNIPMDRSGAQEYPTKYFTQLPVEEYQGEVLELCGDMAETFCQAIYTTDEMNHIASSEIRPAIHFTADSGWTNDPNGMVYADGIYHLYYQYNPFDIVWNNMSWGHAVSPDMLHWEQKDPVMFPDENGTMYSGCAIRNDRELLGLPKEALIFFYTASGGVNPWSGDLEFTQRIAYSLDGGETLVKMEDPCVPVIYKDTRDPKVFWHEESQAYIMVLWTKGNDFAVLRSENLKDWEMTHEFTLDGGWECPDLFNLKSPDGESCWFF